MNGIWTEQEYPGRNAGRWRQPPFGKLPGSVISLAWGKDVGSTFWACRYLGGHMQQAILRCGDMEIIADRLEDWADFERRIGSTPITTPEPSA